MFWFLPGDLGEWGTYKSGLNEKEAFWFPEKREEEFKEFRSDNFDLKGDSEAESDIEVRRTGDEWLTWWFKWVIGLIV